MYKRRNLRRLFALSSAQVAFRFDAWYADLIEASKEDAMNSYVTGNAIRTMREKKGYTQKQLAELLCVSDKTVSKWETSRGLPDITLLEPLAAALGIPLTSLFSGESVVNANRSSNLMRSRFYCCPVCENVLWAVGECSVSCCGITLPPLEADAPDEAHAIRAEPMEDEWLVTVNHPMAKEHFIRFLAYVTADRVQIVHLYPEQEAQARFFRRGAGQLYACCNRHELFRVRV